MKKKVLIFIPHFPVLTETFIEREIYGLVRSKKFDISILAITKGSEFRQKYLEKIVEYKKLTSLDILLGLRFIFLKPFITFKVLGVFSYKRLYLFLKSLGYTHLFSKYSPDILYTHFLSEPSTIVYAAANILGIEYGISAHARDVLEYPELPDFKAASAKFITFCNRNAYQKAQELWGNAKSKFYLSYHGIDEDDLKLEDPNITLNLGRNVILCIGRLTEKKGIDYLIEASYIMKQQNFPHCIYIAGGGSLYEKYNKIIQDKSLEENIILLGSVEFKDVVKYLNLTQVYVQPSIDMASGDTDGIPNGLIEAAFVKKPIVTTNAGSIEEFIDASCGIVIAQRDASALASAIMSLFTNADKVKSLTDTAYKKAYEMFDFNRSILRIADFLAEKN